MIKLADEANQMQNACNGCGLAQRFAEVFKEIRHSTSGTAATNQHPVIKLWLDKFQSLARIPQDYDAASKTYRLVDALAAGNDIEYEVID